MKANQSKVRRYRLRQLETVACEVEASGSTSALDQFVKIDRSLFDSPWRLDVWSRRKAAWQEITRGSGINGAPVEL